MKGSPWRVWVCAVFLEAFFLATTSPTVATGAEAAIRADDVSVRAIADSSRPVEVRWTARAACSVTATVHGPNGEEVAALCSDRRFAPGEHTLAWNARDASGHRVPREAYSVCFRVKDASGDYLLNPLAEPFGLRFTPSNLMFHKETATVEYFLDRACRVQVRMGIEKGPLLRTLVDWEPRPRGTAREHWDGLDETGTRNFSAEKSADYVVKAFALPRMTVIAGDEGSYADYYAAFGRSRRHVPVFHDQENEPTLYATEAALPVHLCRDPELSLAFADCKAGAIVDSTCGTYTLDIRRPDLRAYFLSQRAELVLYLDDVCIDEVEQFRIPFTGRIPWSRVPPGEHWLTFNLVSFNQAVGCYSLKITKAAAPR